MSGPTANLVYLCPLFDGLAQLTANGTLAQNANIYTFLAGTTTDAATYTDSTGDTLNPNPIQVGVTGRLPNQIWLPSGQYTKFVIFDQYGVRLDTEDYVIGTDDPSIAQGSVLNKAYSQANIAYNTANVANALAQTSVLSFSTVSPAVNASLNTTSVYANSNQIGNAVNVNFVNTATVNVIASSYNSNNGLFANVAFQINSLALSTESLSSNAANGGWSNLSSNLLMQWGVAGSVSFAGGSHPGCPGSANVNITFPKPFLSNVLAVQLVTYLAWGNTPRVKAPPTTTGMTIYLEYPNAQISSNNGETTIWWMAIGDQS